MLKIRQFCQLEDGRSARAVNNCTQFTQNIGLLTFCDQMIETDDFAVIPMQSTQTLDQCVDTRGLVQQDSLAVSKTTSCFSPF